VSGVLVRPAASYDAGSSGLLLLFFLHFFRLVISGHLIDHHQILTRSMVTLIYKIGQKFEWASRLRNLVVQKHQKHMVIVYNLLAEANVFSTFKRQQTTISPAHAYLIW